MKFELVEFYPPEQKFQGKTKKNFVGTIHIYIADFKMDIRGIGVCCHKGRMFFNMPSRYTIDPETGVAVKYPIISWIDDSVNKELMDFLQQKVKPIVLESLQTKSKK